MLNSMPLYWLVYSADGGISVVARVGAVSHPCNLRAALANLAEGTFTEGHELEPAMEKKDLGHRRTLGSCFGRCRFAPMAGNPPRN